MSRIVHPLHYIIVKKEATTWVFKPGSGVFHNPHNTPVALAIEERLRQFRLKPAKIMIELFRINGGQTGYYLADLRHLKYYYCGSEWSDVRTTLRQLGIGRTDPINP